jgi:serine/threonine-protein kinase
LKPSNIMVGSFGEVLVLDWGVARVLGTHAGADAGIRMGTPGFMAPEQHAGDPSLGGPASDVYSLGALLASMLGDAAISRRLRAIIQKSTEASPVNRYADAAELVADLAQYRAGLPVSAHKDAWWERASHWFIRYRTFIWLVLAYLVMRSIFAWLR